MWSEVIKVSKGAKIRNRYKHVPNLTHDTNGKVTNSQIDTTNERQEVIPFILNVRVLFVLIINFQMPKIDDQNKCHCLLF